MGNCNIAIEFLNATRTQNENLITIGTQTHDEPITQIQMENVEEIRAYAVPRYRNKIFKFFFRQEDNVILCDENYTLNKIISNSAFMEHREDNDLLIPLKHDIKKRKPK